MYEKNREASALAAISRAFAEQKITSPSANAKSPQPDPAADSAPEPAAARAVKKSKKEKKSNKKDRRGSADHAVGSAQKHQYAEEMNNSREAPAADAPPAPSLPTAAEAFHDWYLAKIAENFEHEIEGLNESDAPVGSRVLLQSLESSISLFTLAEQRVALAAEGNGHA